MRYSTGKVEGGQLVARSGACWCVFVVWWVAVRLSWQSLSVVADRDFQQLLLRFALFLLLSFAGGTLLVLSLYHAGHRLCRVLAFLVLCYILLIDVLMIMGVSFYPDIAIAGLLSQVFAAFAFAIGQRLTRHQNRNTAA